MTATINILKSRIVDTSDNNGSIDEVGWVQ